MKNVETANVSFGACSQGNKAFLGTCAGTPVALTRLRILVFLCNTCAVRTLSILKLYYTLPVSEVVTGELTVMLKAWFPSNFWQGKLNVCIAVFALV